MTLDPEVLRSALLMGQLSHLCVLMLCKILVKEEILDSGMSQQCGIRQHEEAEENSPSRVVEPQNRVKPAAVSDIMWAEAMSKLEGMSKLDVKLRRKRRE